jgi:hypothetical protein
LPSKNEKEETQPLFHKQKNRDNNNKGNSTHLVPQEMGKQPSHLKWIAARVPQIPELQL